MGFLRCLVISIVAIALNIIFLPTFSISSEIVPFPGGIIFHSYIDSMTDRKECIVKTAERGIFAQITAAEAASLWAYNLYVAQTPPPQLRIGKHNPIVLKTGNAPRHIQIPSDKKAEFVQALYAGETILVRFYEAPNHHERTFQLAVGDFSSAYDYAAGRCGWKPIKVSHPVFSPKRRTEELNGRFYEAEFGGPAGWTVQIEASEGYCVVSAPEQSTLFEISQNKELVRPRSNEPIIIRKQSGQEVGRILGTALGDSLHETPKQNATPSVQRVVEWINEVGQYGFLDYGLGNGVASVFGVTEALAFARGECLQSMTNKKFSPQ